MITVTLTYVRMKVQRGDWYGETVQKCRGYLFDFVGYLPTGIRPEGVKRQHIESWLTERAARTAASTRGRLSTVRGLFRWLHAEGRIPRDPVIGISAPDTPESAPRSFTDEEVEQLFDVARRDKRELLIVSLMWNEGMRRAEVAKALLDDINWRTQTMGVRGKFHRGKVSRSIAISPETTTAMKAYLATLPMARSGPLLRSINDPALGLSASRVAAIVSAVIRDAGLKWFPFDGRSSHAGRHTAATQALEAGASTELIKRQFGWVNDATIRRYTKAAALDLHRIHELRADRKRQLEGSSSG